VLLQGRIDELGKELATVRSESAKAYYVVGTEDELLQKGVITREGGANLLVHRFGRTLVPARDLSPTEFTAIDTRAVHTIALPDSTREYQIVSRQSLDDAKVVARDGAKFHGPLQIAEADKFWATSKYLIIVQRQNALTRTPSSPRHRLPRRVRCTGTPLRKPAKAARRRRVERRCAPAPTVRKRHGPERPGLRVPSVRRTFRLA
jgi:hypothetical protein